MSLVIFKNRSDQGWRCSSVSSTLAGLGFNFQYWGKKIDYTYRLGYNIDNKLLPRNSKVLMFFGRKFSVTLFKHNHRFLRN